MVLGEEVLNAVELNVPFTPPFAGTNELIDQVPPTVVLAVPPTVEPLKVIAAGLPL